MGKSLISHAAHALEIAADEFSLLLQPMSFLPAFDAALSELVKTLHDPTKHKITGNECSFPQPAGPVTSRVLT